jgi:hypothetical protein
MKRHPGEYVFRAAPFLGMNYDILRDEWGLYLRWPRLRLLRCVPGGWLRRMWGIV